MTIQVTFIAGHTFGALVCLLLWDQGMRKIKSHRRSHHTKRTLNNVAKILKNGHPIWILFFFSILRKKDFIVGWKECLLVYDTF